VLLERPGIGTGIWLVGSYHVSQQNTFTGRLTEPMLDDVLRRAQLRADNCGLRLSAEPEPG
jgi:uracil-DNA glycosylase